MLNKLHFKYPANLEMAEKHRLAGRIFKCVKEETMNSESCECCGRRIGEEQFEMPCCYNPIDELIFLGPGVPLLFIFIQNALLIFLNISVIFIGYALVSNALGSSCQEDTLRCVQNTFNKLSISNKIYDIQGLTIQTYLLLASIVTFILLVQYLLIRVRRISLKCDELINSPSDYSIIISNLPQNVTKKDIQEMIDKEKIFIDEQEKKQTDNLSVNQIIISYELTKYLSALQKQKQQFMKIKKANVNAPLIQTHIEQPTETTDFAIVVFNRQSSKQKFFQKIRCTKRIKNYFCCCCQYLGSFTIKDKAVGIRRAPEPDDIYWPNSNKKRSDIIKNQILIHSLCIVILCIGGGIQYSIYYLSFDSTLTQNEKNIFSLVSSITVVIFNKIIESILKFLTTLEGTYTRTQMYESLLIKISIYQFFNAGIFTILARILAIQRQNFNIQGNFSSSIILFMIFNGVMPNIINFFKTYLEIPNSIMRFFLRKGCLQYTQYQANKLYELPHVNFPQKYGYIIKTVWLTFFYAPFTPIVVPISILSLVFFYIVESYLFKSSYNIPKMLEFSISKTAMRLLMYSNLFLSLGQALIMIYLKYFLYLQVEITEWIPIFLCLLFSVVTIIIPSYVINKRFFKFEKQNSTSLGYEQAKAQFQLSYEQVNPLDQHYAFDKRSQHNLLKFYLPRLAFSQLTDHINAKKNDKIEIEMTEIKQNDGSHKDNTFINTNQYKRLTTDYYNDNTYFNNHPNHQSNNNGLIYPYPYHMYKGI